MDDDDDDEDDDQKDEVLKENYCLLACLLVSLDMSTTSNKLDFGQQQNFHWLRQMANTIIMNFILFLFLFLKIAHV